MIRKAIYLLIAMFTGISMMAQTIAPLGEGLPNAPEKVTTYKDGLAAVYIDDQAKLQVETWNGDFWTRLAGPEIPAMGTTSHGLLKFKDMVVFQNRIYIIAEHVVDLTNDAPNYVLEWDGQSWKDIADERMMDAVSMDYLVVQDDQLLCVGVFSGTDRNYNIARYTGSEWVLTGNLITRLTGDQFEGLTVSNNKIYATGTFSDPALGKTSLAEWDGSAWEQTPYPPFLGKNEVVGSYKNTVVVYGQGNFTSEKVKMKSGTSWEDISSGLEHYQIHNVNAFEQNGEFLYMLGQFTNTNTNLPVNLLEYKNGEWTETPIGAEPITDLAIVKGQLIVAGKFHDDTRLNFVGELIPFAQIQTGVYNDLNANCVKDEGEDWIRYYPVNLSQRMELITDNSGQLYIPVQKDTYKLNASAAFYYEPTCPDLEIEVKELKIYTGNNFGVRKKPGIRDAVISMVDNKSYYHQVGQTKRSMICVENIGSSDMESAELELSHDENLINFKSDRPYDSYSDFVARWTIDIQAEEKVCFYVEFTPISNADLVLNASVSLNSNERDENEYNNSTSVRYKKGSTLVNEKYIKNGAYIAENEEHIYYKIGFKNVTPSTVIAVRVVDELDPKINPATISPYGYLNYTSSHPYNVWATADVKLNPQTMEYTIKVQWVFSDMALPPSFEDEAGSEGFVDFAVNMRPNVFKKGQQLCNTAYIYLITDEHYAPEPIVTSTVCSSVDDGVGVVPVPEPVNGILIGPNPATNSVEITNSTETDRVLVITNALGQEVMQLLVKKDSSTLVSIEGIEPGVYFIQSEGRLVTKLMVR